MSGSWRRYFINTKCPRRIRWAVRTRRGRSPGIRRSSEDTRQRYPWITHLPANVSLFLKSYSDCAGATGEATFSGTREGEREATLSDSAGYTFTPMTESVARDILGWQYDAPYAFYNAGPATIDDDLLELLGGSYWSAHDATGRLVGFFTAGPSGQLPGGHVHGVYTQGALDVGLGMRPDLTGRGAGLEFVLAGLEFLREERAPAAFRLVVAVENVRAVRVYERAGFEPVTTFSSPLPGDGSREFLLMLRPAY